MNEREEMDAEDQKALEKIAHVRSEMIRMVQGLRSVYLCGIAPSGEMVNLCFYVGYADVRAMQAESAERLAEMIHTNSRRAPSQIL